MDDKNQANPSVNPTTPTAPAAGGINFDQLLITNQEPEAVSANLNDHVKQDAAPVVTPVPAQADDQTSHLLSQANAAFREAPQGPAIDISNIAIEEVTREESKKSAQTLGESGIGAAMLGKA